MSWPLRGFFLSAAANLFAPSSSEVDAVAHWAEKRRTEMKQLPRSRCWQGKAEMVPDARQACQVHRYTHKLHHSHSGIGLLPKG